MIDDLDQKLISELQTDGRQSYIELARHFGVVEGTVRKRIKNLVRRDVIKIAAMPNMAQLGYDFISVIALQVQLADLRQVADVLARKPQICYLAFCTGRYDLISIVITRSPQELAQFSEKELSAIPGILRIEAFVNLDIIKGKGPLIETNQLVTSLDTSSLRGKPSKESRT